MSHVVGVSIPPSCSQTGGGVGLGLSVGGVLTSTQWALGVGGPCVPAACPSTED